TTIDPLLDFAATTTVQGTIIEVDITGSSRAPKIELTSTPTLPQDEAMALLLFGKPSSALSPMELLSAAQALAELTGRQPVGGGFMAKIRGGLGLDNLSINSNASGSGSNQAPRPRSRAAATWRPASMSALARAPRRTQAVVWWSGRSSSTPRLRAISAP